MSSGVLSDHKAVLLQSSPPLWLLRFFCSLFHVVPFVTPHSAHTHSPHFHSSSVFLSCLHFWINSCSSLKIWTAIIYRSSQETKKKNADKNRRTSTFKYNSDLLIYSRPHNNLQCRRYLNKISMNIFCSFLRCTQKQLKDHSYSKYIHRRSQHLRTSLR